jgi:hypothetical protein
VESPHVRERERATRRAHRRIIWCVVFARTFQQSNLYCLHRHRRPTMSFTCIPAYLCPACECLTLSPDYMCARSRLTSPRSSTGFISQITAVSKYLHLHKLVPVLIPHHRLQPTQAVE